MTEDFLTDYCKLITNHPECIKVSTNKVDETYHQITIFAHKEDLGKIIGKQGSMISALKTIIAGCKAKNQISYKLEARAIEN